MPESRDAFVQVLERTRELYNLSVFGYVVMPSLQLKSRKQPSFEKGLTFGWGLFLSPNTARA